MIKTRSRSGLFVATFLLACLAVAPATGCKKDQSTTGEVAQAAQGGFAEGYNELIDEPKDLLKRYFEEFDHDKGPDTTSKDKPRLMGASFTAKNAIDKAKKSFAEAKAGVPTSMKDMPPLADDAANAAQKVFDTYTAVEKYLEAEDYKDDAWAKGKQLHADMVAAKAAYDKAIELFGAALDAVEDVQMEAELKKQSKGSYGYTFRYTNMQAKKLIGALDKPKSADEFRPAFTAAWAAFEPVAAELTTFVSGKGDKINSTFKNWADNVDDIVAECKKLARELDKADGDRISNALNSMISNYNSMVSLATSLQSLEQNGLLK